MILSGFVGEWKIARTNGSGKKHWSVLYKSRKVTLAATLNFVIVFAVGDDETQEAMESAAVFLFSLFKDSTGVTRDEADRLRKTFGPYPASATTKAYSIVKKLITLSPPINATPQSSAVDEQSTLKKEFGHNIHFNNPPVYSAERNYKDSEFCDDSLSEDEGSNETPFSVDNFLIGMINGMGDDNFASEGRGGAARLQEYDDPAASIKYDVAELLEMVGELVVDQVLQLLLSEKDDNSLQNEVLIFIMTFVFSLLACV